MAQYDGRVLIDTEIQTKKAKIQLMALENRIVKTADKIASLRSKMDSLKNAKIPTEQYKTLAKELEKLVQKQNSYNEQLKEFEGVNNKENLPLYKELKEKLEDSYDSADKLIAKIQELSDAGKAFTLGQDTEEYAKLSQQLKYAENDLSVLNQQHEVLELKLKRASEGYRKLGDIAKKSFSAIGNFLKSANSTIDSFGRKIKSIAQSHLLHFRKETDKTGNSFTKFNARLKSLLSGIFIFNVISSGFRKMFSGIGEGFKNFYSQSSAFSNSVDSMRQSLSYLQNSFAAAFSPIIEIAIPYIQKLIDYMSKAVNAIAQFIAALFGKKTYTKATGAASNAISNIGSSADKSNKSINKTSSALGNVADSATEAKKALEGYLSPLDEINKYKTDSDSSLLLGNISSGGAQTPNVGSGLGNAAGDAFGEYFENAIEEIPIDSYFKELAEKAKDVISKLFKPLKEAWSGEGKFVMDSWKSALKEVGNLIKSVGSDFLEVWQQEKTVKIFEDLLHIIGDIGQVASNLAHNFRLAWDEGETGKRILEGIRDIIGVIVANIRHAADVTVEWAKNIDFTPLLTKMKDWVASLVPVIDNLSGIVTDFYEHVLLPLGKWVLEKGLPDLLQVFIDFNNKVDWEALRARLAEFWKHLEPFAETVGEGLIIFIGRLADALAHFINSPAFEKFLKIIENWMDNVKPEDVADALGAIAKSIIALKVALAGFSAISKVLTIFSSLSNILKLFGAGGGISSALGVLKSIGTTIAGWAPHIAVGIAIVDVIKKIKDAVSDVVDTSNFGFSDWISATFDLILKGLKQELEVIKVSFELWWQDTWMADKIWKFGQWWNEKVAPWFTKGKWSELWKNISDSLSGKWNDVLKSWENLKQNIFSKWKEIKENAENTWSSVKDSLADTWSSIKQTASQKWQEIKQNLSEKWNNLKNNVKTSFDSIGSSIKETWENVKNSSVSLVSSMTENIREKFSNIQSSISNFSSGIQSKWQSVWSTMQSKVQSVMESVKSSLNSAFEWINKKIQDIQKSIKGISTSAQKVTTGGIGGAIGGGFGKVSYYLANSAFAALNSVEIPKLATGAVIPANREFLAVLGDQKNGTNIEAPLDTIKQAFREEASSLGLLGNAGGNGNLTLKVYLEDSQLLNPKKIFEAVITEGKVQQMSTGKNRLLLEN